MARKGNDPGKMGTEKEAGSKRRYRSPQTPPQAPRSSPGTQQGRGQTREQDLDTDDFDTEDFDTEDLGEGHPEGRGTSQEYGQGQRQGRGLTEDAEGAATGIGADFDLQKASRDELNAIARELDIEDFETMNREELVMEIRERS